MSKKKYVYLFREGNGSMRELLGGKGANLAEMTNLGMPVPPDLPLRRKPALNTMRTAKLSMTKSGKKSWPTLPSLKKSWGKSLAM